MATLVGTLLVLAAFGVPEAAAKTGDATCVAKAIWFDDPDNDGGQFVANPLDPSGFMEIDKLEVEETGTDCGDITWTFTVGDAKPGAEPDSVTYKIDLLEPSGATDDWSITVVIGEGEGATLMRGTTEVTAGASGGGTGSSISLTADKALFVGLTKWDGASATTESVNRDPDVTFSGTPDTASSDVDLLVDFGLDADSDGLPDAWERAMFGDTTTSDGNSTTDTDGDGISDVDEYKNGTDPNDPNDPPSTTNETDEGNETEEEVIEDEDGVPGMGENDTIPAGGVYCTVFNEAGEFAFHDANQNKLTVEVEAPHDDNGTDDHGDGETHDVTITSAGFDPDTIHIHTGDEVCFTNDDTEDQTVQSADDGNGIDFSKLTDNSGYAIIALGGMAAVVVLSIIALAARWKL